MSGQARTPPPRRTEVQQAEAEAQRQRELAQQQALAASEAKRAEEAVAAAARQRRLVQLASSLAVLRLIRRPRRRLLLEPGPAGGIHSTNRTTRGGKIRTNESNPLPSRLRLVRTRTISPQ